MSCIPDDISLPPLEGQTAIASAICSNPWFCKSFSRTPAIRSPCCGSRHSPCFGTRRAYVITSRCQSNCLQDCVKTCPVDAIHGPTDAEHVLSARASGRPLDPSLAKVQMFIDPETCIDCNMCTETCPVAAPFWDEEVPVEYEGDIQQNADFFAA